MYHGLVFLVIVPLMFKAVYDVSKCMQSPTASLPQWDSGGLKRLIFHIQLPIPSTLDLSLYYPQDGYQVAWSTTQMPSTRVSETMFRIY